MSDRFHDEYLRRTPVELLMPEGLAAPDLMEVIWAAAVEASVASDPARMTGLPPVREFLEKVREAEDAPESGSFYGALLFHAVHQRDVPGPLLLDEKAARWLVALRPPRAWVPSTPASAGYLQLPRNLFWTSAGGDIPEPLDGISWVLTDEALHVLIAVGVRDDRPGLAVVELSHLPVAEMDAWLREPGRDGEEDFSPTLPGGVLGGLFSVETAGEALKLLARTFMALDRGLLAVGDAVLPPPPDPQALVGAGAPPVPSRLPYRLVGLASHA